MKLSIVIPAFNEESVIGHTLRDVGEYARKHFSEYEIIVVDDGSTDKTAALTKNITGVILISYKPNQGKGYAVKRGVASASGDYILFMDADNSTSITELDHCMKEIESSDIVIGSRAVVGAQVEVSQNQFKRFLGRIGNTVIRTALQLRIKDTQCGFKLFRPNAKPLFEQLKLTRWGFDFEFLFLAQKKGLRIHESPVRWVNNFDSKVSALSYLQVLTEVVKVRLWYLLGRY